MATTYDNETAEPTPKAPSGTLSRGQALADESLPEAGNFASRVKSSAADRMQTAADFFHERADTTRVGWVIDGAARGMDQAASYVRRTSFAEVANDVSSVIRRYPIRSLAVGLGIGLACGRLSRR